VREMMFGTRERFHYARCKQCGALVLLDAPTDLTSYYPAGYYSLGPPAIAEGHGFAGRLRRARSDALLRLPVAFADRLVEAKRVPPFFGWLAGRGVSTSASVVDVGSGSGKTLLHMARHGFTALLGVDPHLAKEGRVGSVRLRRQGVDQLTGRFDVAMLNHVLEHLPEPRAVLATMRDRLTSGGTLVIRVPLADSWAARNYGPDWVQIDAPRHLVLPTEAGIAAAARASGLRVWRSFRDSGALQFWGSEQYRRDIPLRDPASWAEAPLLSVFSQDQIDRWGDEARRLNRRRQGDSAVFVITRA
jgi:SAM-dependent methyltransferase